MQNQTISLKIFHTINQKTFLYETDLRTLSSSSADPAVAIEECIHAFQTAKDQISEQTKSWLGKREQSRMQALAVKARELKLGVNREICLREMRETAYNIGRSERANEKNRPAWYCITQPTIFCFTFCY